MNQKKKHYISIACALGISLLATGGIVYAHQEEIHQQEIQRGLAEEVFRFHVLANSDSAADQKLKMQVKEAVISYMKEELPESENTEETKKWAKSHLNEIEAVAEEEIEKTGSDYEVKAEVTNCAFPQKVYGDVTFPAGYYDALRIEIGEAEGQNWWCVLYPNLCFMDSVRAVVPDEGKEQLKEVLTEEEYEEITEVKIEWFCLQMCEGMCRITEIVNWK